MSEQIEYVRSCRTLLSDSGKISILPSTRVLLPPTANLWLVKYRRSTAVEYAIVLNYMLEIARPDPYPDKYSGKINNHSAVSVDL
jgi:hypothetical protein